MNKLSIITDYLNEEKTIYQLNIAVDGIPLYRYFEACIDDDIDDSIALPFKDPHDLKDLALLWDTDFYWKGNEDFIWFLTDSSEDEVLPLLSCPDDAEELDCLLLAAYVRKSPETIYWDRIGRIIHAEDEWHKMADCGFRCKDVLSEKDCLEYGFETPVYQVVDGWVSDHWREELFRRDMGFLRNHYKTPAGVKWLQEVNWQFSAENYWEVVNFFREGLKNRESSEEE